MKRLQPELGLWLVGAGGNIAATVAVGLAAIEQKRSPPIGLLTESDVLTPLHPVALDAIVLGGHEIRAVRPADTARRLMAGSGVFNEMLIEGAAGRLRELEKNTRPGIRAGAGRAVAGLPGRDRSFTGSSGRAVVDRIRRDLRAFQDRNGLDRVVVVNVASTEPSPRRPSALRQWSKLAIALAGRGPSPAPASCLYAIAAIEESMPYVNFTPSIGADVPAIRERAETLGTAIMGNDGKTGETLIKSAVAPMFAARALEVMSWDGHNILGNLDGRVLADPATKASKLKSKGNVVSSILGYFPQTPVSIEYVESLNDWKIAWDHVHFRGFLGTRMSLQFVWQGVDSLLAAPLVIDLARLADVHAREGRGGVMSHLASYFKAPMGGAPHDLPGQMALLRDYVAKFRPGRRKR